MMNVPHSARNQVYDTPGRAGAGPLRFCAQAWRYLTWIAATIANVAMTVTLAIIVKSGIAVDFADFVIAIPSSPARVNRIHRKCVLAVTA
jgi:hypothetical protein